jgi:hypothetical protein
LQAGARYWAPSQICLACWCELCRMSCWPALSRLEACRSSITSTIRWCECRLGSRPANKAAHLRIARAGRLRASKVIRRRTRSSSPLGPHLIRFARRANHVIGFLRAASLARPGSDRNRIRVKLNLLKRFNLIWAVQSLPAKIFRFPSALNAGYFCTVPACQRGASRSSRTLERDAMDAGGAADERVALRTAKSCGPDAPTPASSQRRRCRP